jgi:hypothetical protein
MKVQTVFEYHELVNLQTAIIVECWEYKNYGRVKRAWLKEFTEAERAKAGVLYKTFYNWHMVKGIPSEHRMTINTYEFIKKLVNFFATT